jgi:hypothetical protein
LTDIRPGSRSRAHCLFLTCGLLITAPVHALQVTGAAVSGAITDVASGAPIRAEVQLENSRRRIVADSSGDFSFRGVSAGTVTLSVRAIGYAPQRVVVAVGASEPVVVTIRLAPLPVSLQPMQTVALSADRERFEEAMMPSMVSIDRRELSRLPYVGERDVVRAAAMLPGIAVRNDFSAGFNVRGGEADQSLVLLDGVPIYNPFHMGGLFGAFIDPAVERVDVHTGGFPAEFGGRLSSVLNVVSNAEVRPGVHGTTDVSLLSTSTRIGGMLGGGRLSWNAAGRRTYADRLIDAIGHANGFPYHLQDAQLHVRANLPRQATLSLTAYTGKDLYSTVPDHPDAPHALNGTVAFDWGNSAAGMQLVMPLGAHTSMSHQVSVSGFDTHFRTPAESLSLRQWLTEARISGRVTRTVSRHTVTAGYQVTRLESAYYEMLGGQMAEQTHDGSTAFQQYSGSATLFIDDVYRVNARLVLRPGVRVEQVAAADWTGISPRVSGKLFLSDNLAITAAAGRYAQWMRAVRNEDLPVRMFDLWLASDAEVAVSTARHAVIGLEHWIGQSRFLRVEGYHKRYDKLTEPASTIDTRIRPSMLRSFDGSSYGVDFHARQLARGGLAGWISYGYGVSTRERDGRRYFPAHDRRHNGNVALTYAPGARYAFGAHFAAASGTPYTGWAGIMQRWRYDPVSQQWAPSAPDEDDDVVRGGRNAARLPTYLRLDLSAERRFEVGRTILRPSLNLINVLNRRNVLLYALDPAATPPRLRGMTQFPFLPSLGLRVDF